MAIYYRLTTIAKAHTLPGKHFPKMSENKKNEVLVELGRN
jgi:hypothetical protein